MCMNFILDIIVSSLIQTKKAHEMLSIKINALLFIKLQNNKYNKNIT